MSSGAYSYKSKSIISILNAHNKPLVQKNQRQAYMARERRKLHIVYRFYISGTDASATAGLIPEANDIVLSLLLSRL